ncbi:hypothetical protein GCM10011571_13760 [Marinithermofilum abyssi]|uniref:YitT family protein n=1 Tax=Marinithermofilum abyssi TaxID=1571185 RepID=A0A8J2VBU5_9BACL|nr:YitT family protein [Marinithermofilum abyssi]GGE13555.1 hypothetical protein GCM10011571_13760 [Marinithermofilum abyssi]
MYRHGTIWLGGSLIGLGVQLFITPHRLLDGGILGIALILQYLWGMHTGCSMILLSLPVFIFLSIVNRKMLISGLYGMLISSGWIELLEPMRGWLDWSLLPSALIGGLLIGCGVGLMMCCETSTGGLDLLAQWIAQHKRWNAGLLIFLWDTCILACGSWFFDPLRILYTFLTVSCAGLATSLLLLWKKNPSYWMEKTKPST